MKNGNVLIALIVGGVIGFVVGKATSSPSTGGGNEVAANDLKDNGDQKKPDAKKGTGGDDPNAIYRVPVGNSPIRGDADAKVTIVEFSDFECPFCQRGAGTIKQVEEKYGKDVRLVYKQNPLPMHSHSKIASEASLAAGEQGKFWEMHDQLFAHRDHLERADLEKYATDIGLDMTKFKAAMDAHKFDKEIMTDQALAQQFQAGGTPHFFVDGHRVVGAQPIEKFASIIDEDIKKADALIAAGTPRNQLYDRMVASGLNKAEQPTQNKNQPTPPAQVQSVPAEKLVDAPFRGPKDAKVTIVEWSDFQCPYCGRVAPTVEEIMKAYPKDVRFYFMNEPLPMHPNAQPAAIAAVAAQKQGKFWEMYDKLFKNQTQLSPDNYVKWAGEIGLNVAKFKADLEDPKTKERVSQDAMFGQKVGANGTPTFFVDGREVSGALPLESFKSMIDEEIKKADAQLKNGVPQDKLYATLNDLNVKTAPKAAAAAPADDGKPVHIEVGSSPTRGPANAPVTIIQFSDFQCPFCGRVEPTVTELEKKYGNKIKVVWKNQPLPFHPNARPAAKAALAAASQGKFWEMHDKLFSDQSKLSDAIYEQYAQELGLNMTKFKSDMAKPDFDVILDNDSRVGKEVGAQGTPTFFINGKKFVGAQPLDSFVLAIDDALGGKK